MRVACLFLAFPAAGAEESRPARVPWTTSRLQGSPDPGKRCASELVFPGIELNQGLELVSWGGRFHVVERGGRVWSFPEQPAGERVVPDLTIDLKALHPGMTNAYGLAFHPKCAENGEVFLAYTVGNDVEDGTRVSRFRLSGVEPPRLDPASEEVIITWWAGGHNGAALQFGPDGLLYISTGDGTAPSPPDGKDTGQDNSDLLSAILRIDIDAKEPGRAYRVPVDNPFVGREGVRPEIWSFGFRNPWKMSFDERGGLWVGDVGWELWEMIHLAGKGTNHGWSAMEAAQPIKPESASDLAPILPPVAAHPHSEAASITGGFVYRGSSLPELRGAYVYGDYETGRIWALWHDGGRMIRHEEIADTPHKIATFGLGSDGEIYYLHYGSPATMHRLVPNPKAGKTSDFPMLLSETGLFRDTAARLPADGVYEYAVIEPMWQDGAEATRHIALPADSSVDTEITIRPSGNRQSRVVWPAGAVLAKTIRLGERPVETQVMLYDGETWNGYAYRWNEAGTDAALADAAGEDVEVGDQARWKGGPVYRIGSRADCLRCHTQWNEFVAGFQPMQLAGFAGHPGLSAREVAVGLGLTDGEYFERDPAGRLVASRSGGGSLEARARSWLHANCAHCHRRHGGGSAPLEVNFDRALSEAALLWQRPTRGDFGIADARAIVPGEPWRSVLNYRVSAIGSGHMPPLGTREVDEAGVRLLWDWVASLPREAPVEGAAVADYDTGLLGDTASAMRLAHAVAVGQGEPKAREESIQAGLAAERPEVRALFERFRPAGERPRPHLHQAGSILKLTGDPGRGAALLSPTGKLAACLACHRVGDVGRDFGPDLTTVGTRLDHPQLLESLLEPSRVLAEGFQLWTVETRSGESHSGFLAGRDGGAVALRIDPEITRRWEAAEVRRAYPLPTSPMPAGLVDFLTEAEVADVLAWLGSLKGR